MRVSSYVTQPDPEPLLYPAGMDAIKSVVINASAVTADISNYNRRVLLPGTLLTAVTQPSSAGLSATSKVQYQQYAGTGLIAGVLAKRVEFFDGSDNSDESAGMFYQGCVFRATAIAQYSTYGANAASTLPTCRFENV